MEPARLAASSKLHPQGPWGAPEQQGSRNPKENTTLSGMVLGQQKITFGTRKARVPAAKVRAPSGPKIAQNHQKRAPVPPWGVPEGSVVQVDGQNQLGYWLGCLLAVFGPMWPRNSICWAQNGFIWAPNVAG